MALKDEFIRILALGNRWIIPVSALMTFCAFMLGLPESSAMPAMVGYVGLFLAEVVSLNILFYVARKWMNRDDGQDLPRRS